MEAMDSGLLDGQMVLFLLLTAFMETSPINALRKIIGDPAAGKDVLNNLLDALNERNKDNS